MSLDYIFYGICQVTIFDRIILLYEQHACRMRLGKGHILLIAGGAIAAVSFSVLGFYGMKLVASLEAGEKHRVDPNESRKLAEQQIVNSSQGAYLVSFPAFTGGRPTVTIKDPMNRTILEKGIDPPIIIEAFPTATNGNYTLTLFNPSSDQVLEASVLLGEQKTVLTAADASSAILTLVFGFLFISGIAAVIAGAGILILDRRRTSRMKQFGDTSDLV